MYGNGYTYATLTAYIDDDGNHFTHSIPHESMQEERFGVDAKAHNTCEDGARDA